MKKEILRQMKEQDKLAKAKEAAHRFFSVYKAVVHCENNELLHRNWWRRLMVVVTLVLVTGYFNVSSSFAETKSDAPIYSSSNPLSDREGEIKVKKVEAKEKRKKDKGRKPNVQLPDVDPLDEKAEGEIKTVKGKVSGRNNYGLAVEYGSNSADGVLEIWSTLNRKTQISGVKSFYDIQEGDIVELKYKKLNSSGKNVLKSVGLVKRKPKETDKEAMDVKPQVPQTAKPKAGAAIV